MRDGGLDQGRWEQALLEEARRDLVFVFNVTAGAFGGPRPAPKQADVPALLRRVAAALLAEGCTVGFGEPGTKSYSVPKELQVAPEHLAESIAHYYANDPEKAKFLAFAHRPHTSNRRDA